MLMCINGLEEIQHGRISVDGVHAHSKQTDLNKLRQKIGIVFQQWNAFPHLTVWKMSRSLRATYWESLSTTRKLLPSSGSSTLVWVRE
jgi:ABC-type polar amino acid transport system ATPase subunit